MIRLSPRPARLAFAFPFAVSLTLTLVLAAQLVAPSPATAQEVAWVRGEVRLNLRTGPGNQYKILGVVTTGDELRVISRGEDWTQVETAEGKRGWIPGGYLATEPPPTLRVQQLETETTALRAELEEIRAEASRLRETNATLASTDSGQREEIEALKIENFELRAGSTTQKWITGAAILAGGMLVGAILHRNSTRRPSSRIRL
ncbi:MAG: TIGR04211 family SH3 domain-containing protein [Spirochaetaceae bacterium]|nr:TIGR04211 family SH3 domain-containing protein [Myxococcales bacterium]MCB9725633.1 TIGR04211 family SH3 domain-containing protein [Spirochaetaceae bacterium]HPG26722.1 TIGR04211 family SH3 domain-containing protein [Myxococcota bacterium]